MGGNLILRKDVLGKRGKRLERSIKKIRVVGGIGWGSQTNYLIERRQKGGRVRGKGERSNKKTG